MMHRTLATTSNAVAGIDQQASEIRGRSMSLAEETLSNTFDFAHKLVHARQMSDLLNLQSEFFSRQAQVVAAQSKEVGESTVRGVHETSQDIEHPRRGPKLHNLEDAWRTVISSNARRSTK